MSEIKESPHAIIEEAGLGFDPGSQHLDLSKEEKRRTTALLMAIQAYRELIIKDADMLRAVADESRRGEGPKIQPATMEAMVNAAIRFDDFISGKLQSGGESRGGVTAELQSAGQHPESENSRD